MPQWTWIYQLADLVVAVMEGDMTPDEALQELKKIKAGCIQEWVLPLKLNREDALAAELIEIAIDRLGNDSKHWQLLAVASSFFLVDANTFVSWRTRAG